MEDHGLVSIEGRVVKATDAKIPLEDRGFLFGDAIFETLVAFGPQVLDLEAHLARLRFSAEEMHLTLPWSDAELQFEIQSLVETCGYLKSNIRLMITRGHSVQLKISADLKPFKAIWCRPADPISAAMLENGLALKRKNQPFTLRGAMPKAPNYVRSAIAIDEAQKAGFDDVIWANSEGEFTESSTANVFFVARQGDTYEVVTPSVHCGILAGITRKKVIEICQNSGADMKEIPVFVDELPRFDEAFICSTVRGLVPVSRIDKHRLHTTHERSFFRALHGAYLRLTWEKLGKKVDWSTGRS